MNSKRPVLGHNEKLDPVSPDKIVSGNPKIDPRYVMNRTRVVERQRPQSQQL